MKLLSGDQIVLFGSASNIEKALSDEKVKSLEIIGICQCGLLAEIKTDANLPIISLADVDKFCGKAFVVVDENLLKPDQAFFETHGVRYGLLSELCVEVVSAPEVESVQEEQPVEEESVAEQSVVEEETIEQTVAEQVEESEEQLGEVIEQEQVVEEQSEKPSVLDKEQFDELKKSILAYYDAILQTVKITKSKDDSIYAINKELQKYKDDYYYKSLSPIISELISLREDCKKSMDSLTEYNLTREKQIDYLGFSVEQIENLLDVQGVEVKDFIYYFNGKAIYPTGNNVQPLSEVLSKEEPTVQEKVENEIEIDKEVSDLEGLAELVKNSCLKIENAVAENEKLLKTIALQADEAKKQGKICDGLLTVPIFIKLIQLIEYIEKVRRALGAVVDEDESAETYTKTYKYCIEYVETVLNNLGVFVKTSIDDTYDPKYHRVLKMQKITQEESDKDRKIAKFSTDCYLYGEKVIQPAKVIVYKL